MSDIVVGIDLGTTNSCAAYYYDNDLIVLENAEGDRITPSVVYFRTPEQSIVGQYAKKMGPSKPDSAIFEIKRLIGRQMNDPDVVANLKYFPYKLDSHSEEPTIVIEDAKSGSIIKKKPSEVSALILTKIKNDIEQKFGHEIKKAVITVPAYFNVSQRGATLLAAEEAGFQVLKLLNEPIAVALNYYHYKKEDNISPHYSLVYDLGGGTFDVAVLKKSKDNIEIICVDGDNHLGGHDFDEKIFDYVFEEILIQHNVNIKKERRKIRRMLVLCEEAKKDISLHNIPESPISLRNFLKIKDDLDDGPKILVTQERFEEIIKPLLQKTIQIVDNCLKTSKLTKNDIAEIILAGGSSRIPKIQKMLSEYFNGKQLNNCVNLDECVAKGAALQAALLSTNIRQKIESIKILEVTSASLGISDNCDRMSVVIPKKSKIPITKSITCVNQFDKQTFMTLNIYEGERLMVKKNCYLGTLIIDDLTSAPPEQCEVVVKMSIDNNGILKISAQEKYKSNTKDLKITYGKSFGMETEIKDEIQSIEEDEAEDRKFDKFTTWKAFLNDYCTVFCYNINKRKLNNDYGNLYKLCMSAVKKASNFDVEDEKQLKELTETTTNRCNSVAILEHFELMPAPPTLILNELQKKTMVKH